MGDYSEGKKLGIMLFYMLMEKLLLKVVDPCLDEILKRILFF